MTTNTTYKTGFCFNITEKELKKALKFAKKNGTPEFGTIAMHVMSGGGIGHVLKVSDLEHDKVKDISNYGAW